MRAPAYFTGKQYPVEQITIAGRVWVVTTNGEAIAAGAFESSDAPPVSSEKRAQSFGDNLSVAVPADADRVDVSALVHMLGGPARYPVDSTCPECRGTRRHPEADGDCACARCICDACDHRGFVQEYPARRECTVRGAPFDANLVAVSLDIAHAEGPCRVWVYDAGIRTLFVDGDGWRVVVCPLSHLFDERTARRLFSRTAPASDLPGGGE